MKLIIGAHRTQYEGWTSTDKDTLNISDARHWHVFVQQHGAPTHILSEHVWEHLTMHESELAAALIHSHVTNNGRVRIAVPDALHPSPDYLDGIWPPRFGHLAMYDYRSLAGVFLNVGFRVELLEWWDEKRRFHRKPWSVDDGMINRSFQFDARNKDCKPNFTSLIIDAHKL